MNAIQNKIDQSDMHIQFTALRKIHPLTNVIYSLSDCKQFIFHFKQSGEMTNSKAKNK